MANLSIGGSIKAAVVAWGGVSGRVFRSDKVPENPTFPYVTFMDAVSMAPALEGDCATMARARLVTVDVWQKSKDEDPLLPERLVNALDGAGLSDASQHVYGCKVIDCVRLDDPDDSISHHALSMRPVHAATITP